jgi:hypothetical protein
MFFKQAVLCLLYVQTEAFRGLTVGPRKLLPRVVHRSTAATDVFGDGGVMKLVAKEGSGDVLKDGSVVVVRYNGVVGKGASAVTFAVSDSATMTLGDGTMIPGDETDPPHS